MVSREKNWHVHASSISVNRIRLIKYFSVPLRVFVATSTKKRGREEKEKRKGLKKKGNSVYVCAMHSIKIKQVSGFLGNISFEC